jgi:hypothetical protein
MKFHDIDILFKYYDKYEIWLKLLDTSSKTWCNMTSDGLNILISYKGKLFTQISKSGEIKSRVLSEDEVYKQYILSFIREMKLEDII